MTVSSARKDSLASKASISIVGRCFDKYAGREIRSNRASTASSPRTGAAFAGAFGAVAGAAAGGGGASVMTSPSSRSHGMSVSSAMPRERTDGTDWRGSGERRHEMSLPCGWPG